MSRRVFFAAVVDRILFETYVRTVEKMCSAER
jgi:hypothetical protein